MEKLKITLKTFYGSEEVLKEELQELGYKDVQVLNRAVQIEGAWRDVYFLNLHIRCALSVIVELANFTIREEKDLYKQAKKIDWSSYFDINKTFAIKGAVFSNIFSHSQYPYLLVKDAVVDHFKEKVNDRPNIQVKNPQVLFDLYIKENKVTISLNTSGAPLYMRGYRQETGKAPINEVLAAIMIRMSKWDRKSPFIDPFCGSGTLLIEAALLAHDIPSNIERQHYAFKNFNNYHAETWEEIYESANKAPKNKEVKIIGSDKEADMIFATKRNLRTFPFGKDIHLSVNSFQELTALNIENGTLICNPPYGERIGDGIEEMYEELGTWFKHNLPGFSCWIISSNMEALKAVGLRPSQKHKLFNGDLECSFREYKMFEGSKKDHVMSQM